jgi:hypothetical protein
LNLFVTTEDDHAIRGCVKNGGVEGARNRATRHPLLRPRELPACQEEASGNGDRANVLQAFHLILLIGVDF